MRLNENEDLTNSNQIGKKTSNFFTETIIKPYDFFNLKYGNALKNNFSEISNENLEANFDFNELLKHHLNI